MNKRDGSFSRLPEKLRKARVEQGLTQAALSDGIVTRNMLSRIENGLALPSIPVISALAERLSLPVGYFLDDRDDGSAARDRRLLDLALEEWEQGHYDACLTFCRSLEDYEEIRDALSFHCLFRLAVESFYDGRFAEAQKLFSDCEKEKRFGEEIPQICLLYATLMKGFSADPASGKEKSILIGLRRVSSFPHDLNTVSSLLALLDSGKTAEAKALLSVSVFRDKAYRLLSTAVLQMAENDFSAARIRLIEMLGCRIPPPIECYALTLLEACAAAEKDFETAYAYLVRRRDRVAALML